MILLDLLPVLLVWVTRIFFLTGTLFVLILRWIYPALLEYGKTTGTRDSVSSGKGNHGNKEILNQSRGKFLLNYLLSCRTPRSFFKHFYIIGTIFCLSSLVFLIYTSGQLSQTSIPLLLITFQIIRRLYECIYISKSNPTSTMHLFHYLAGVLFYIFAPFTYLTVAMTARTNDTLNAYWTCIPISIYFACSYFQYKSHVYLASLKNQNTLPYKFPKDFNFSLTPHYVYEILMYWILSFLSGFEWTSVLVAVWVTVDLVLASESQYNWYKLKFKEEYYEWKTFSLF